MTSTTANNNNNPYTFPRPSQLATRTLVGEQKTSETPSASSYDAADAAGKPVLQRRLTDNYAQAAAAAASAGQQQHSPTATSPTSSTGGGEWGGASATEFGDERPLAARRQSWKMSDFKREKIEPMLAAAPNKLSYTSTTNSGGVEK